jgi:DNA end-binding protein Ku
MKKTNKARIGRDKGKKLFNTPEKKSLQGIWSGTISFSLVAIPVLLVKSVEPGRVSFHMLHNKDFSPLERKMFCPLDEKIVPSQDIIRGYEIEPGKHVIITQEELESVSPDRSRTIEILEFIDISEVDPLYYDHPYFLVPLKGGEKSYKLLAAAMQKMNRAGIAQFVLDERECLVLIKSANFALSMSTLHYSDEILSDEGMALVPNGATNAEINGIKNHIKDLMARFAPEKYSNSRREKILELLNKKAQVEAPEIEEAEKAEGMADLMSALEESMRKVKKTHER